MKTAGAIIRVSTARQLEGTSPEKQVEKILTLAREQEFEIGKRHIWQLAESGGSRERVGFREALAAGQNGEISRLYVFSIDRLGRNLLEMLLFLRQLEDLGIECWSADKGQRLQGDDFLLQIEGAVASKERQEILKRTQDGLLRAIRGGKYSGGIVAYGYCINPETKALEIEPAEADVVRMMFKWCTEERISCVAIAERLTAMGIPTRYQKDGRLLRRKGKRSPEKTDGVWRAGRVLNMLRNPAYMGKWEWGKRSKKRSTGDTIAGLCPALVSEQAFAQASEFLKQNQLLSYRNSKREYLLRGLIKCDLCGKTFCGSYSRVGPSKSKEQAYYACNGRTQWRKLAKPKCPSAGVRADELEVVVWEDIKAYCKHPEVVLEQLRAQRVPVEDDLTAKLEDVASQMAELRRQEFNLLRIASTSQEVDTAALDQLLAGIHSSQKQLTAYQARLKSQQLRSSNIDQDLIAVSERLSLLGTRIDEATFEERRRAVEMLVKEIRVQPQTVAGKMVPVVTITYRFNEPWEEVEEPPSAVVIDRTPVHADIMGTRSSRVRARPRR